MKIPRRKRTGYQLQSFPKPAPDSDRGSVDRESGNLLALYIFEYLPTAGRPAETCPQFL